MLLLLVSCAISLAALGQETPAENGTAWPAGAYCLLAGEDGCFEPFEASAIQLAVPKIVQPGDRYFDEERNQTERFIKYGTFGDSALKAHDWDQVYRLKIVACCKKK